MSVACYDLGEFFKLYPFSKLLSEKLNCKSKLMKLVESNNDDIKE